jgi:hypothetical protein
VGTISRAASATASPAFFLATPLEIERRLVGPRRARDPQSVVISNGWLHPGPRGRRRRFCLSCLGQFPAASGCGRRTMRSIGGAMRFAFWVGLALTLFVVVARG